MLVGCAVLEPAWRAVVAVFVMAVLSPVMGELGAASVEKREKGLPMSDVVAAEFADVVADIEPTAEQLAAIEAGAEGAPDDFNPEGGDVQ